MWHYLIQFRLTSRLKGRFNTAVDKESSRKLLKEGGLEIFKIFCRKIECHHCYYSIFFYPNGCDSASVQISV